MSNNRYRSVYLDGWSHFCTASIVQRLPLLVGDQACRLVLHSWRKQSQRYAVLIEGFVIMPDHLHLLVRGSGEGVRKFMQYSLAESSRGLQRILESRSRSRSASDSRHFEVVASRANGRSAGKVWKERSRAFPVDRERDLLVKLEYIHNNPVRRGLVEDAQDWPWSSYGSYHGGESVFPVQLVLSCEAGDAAGTHAVRNR